MDKWTKIGTAGNHSVWSKTDGVSKSEYFAVTRGEPPPESAGGYRHIGGMLLWHNILAPFVPSGESHAQPL